MVLTYRMLHREVCKFANCLKSLGVNKGGPGFDLHADGARTGDCDVGLHPHRRDHSVVFGSFRPKRSPTATRTPRQKVQITANGGWRRGKVAAEGDRRRGVIAERSKCIVLKRTSTECSMKERPRCLVARP